MGRRLAEVDSKFLSQVVVLRKTTKDGISHRGNYVQLEHCGTDPVLHTSVLARISFALGAGVECFRPFVDQVVACAQELQLPTAAAICQDWESRSRKSGLVPHRTLRVLARDLMTATALSRHEDPDAPPAAVTIVTTPSSGINRRELYEGELAARYCDDDELAKEDVTSKGSVKRGASRDSGRSSSKNPRLGCFWRVQGADEEDA